MTIRVGTFNLLHGLPGGGRPGRPSGSAAAGDRLPTAAALLDADVLGVQEVDRYQARSGRVDQTAVVAEALGAPWSRFVATLIGTPGRAWVPAGSTTTSGGVGGSVDPSPDEASYGVGLVSRLPVLEWDVLRFPAARASLPLLVLDESGRTRLLRVADEPRAALAAVVEGPRGPFTVVTGHLSFVPGVNVRQLRLLSRWTRRFPHPLVVAGDLNLPASTVRLSTRMRLLVRTPTFPASRPRVQLDHVLARDLPTDAVVGARGHRLPVSDHCALSVDLDL